MLYVVMVLVSSRLDPHMTALSGHILCGLSMCACVSVCTGVSIFSLTAMPKVLSRAAHEAARP